MELIRTIRRQYNGQQYQVQIFEVRQVMPWGTEPCCFEVAKWERLDSGQLDMFDNAV